MFDPTPSTVSKSIQLQTADVGQDGDLVISSWVSYANSPLVLGTNVVDVDHIVRHRTMFELGGAYAFGGKFEAGARMPFYTQSGDPVDTSDGAPYSDPPASGTVLGDLTLHGKMRFTRSEKFGMAGGLTIKLPTATDDEFAGTDMPSVRTLLFATYSPTTQITIITNAGAVLRKKVEFANSIQGIGAAWGAGVQYRIAHPLFLQAEAFGEVVPNGKRDVMKVLHTQVTTEYLGGLHYQLSPQYSVSIAAGRGLTNGIGAPVFRGMLSFAYTPSGRPLPPLHKPEVIVPIDPNTNDADFDKFVDAKDKCPNDREDKDGFQDDDGCPDPDNDNDGVPDEKDKCVMVAEDKDKFEDGDGCPEDDNDRDGVVDASDACPNEAEKINGVDDDDGCPDKGGESLVISTPDRLELLESVQFNGTAIAKSSINLLGQLEKTLRARSDIVRLRIGVHVQPTNKPEKDQALSDKRGNAIREWLIAHGIAGERIDPKGFGGSKPLASPSQKNSALMNERVELIILERR